LKKKKLKERRKIKERELLRKKMAISSRVVVFLGLIYASLMSIACSQSMAPAPAPTSDGKLYEDFDF
jgi:hypothetical protein